MKTLWLVNTKYLAALGAAPSFLFVSDELPYAQVFDICEIAYHAHATLGSIPLIQMAQLDARKVVTTVAVLDSSLYDLGVKGSKKAHRLQPWDELDP
jgi:hypothetical protein